MGTPRPLNFSRSPIPTRPERCRRISLYLLESALMQIAPITHSESALTNSLDLKSFRIRTYKKDRGRGSHPSNQKSFPLLVSLRTPKIPTRIYSSFQSLMKCKFRNPFLLIFMQIGGGVYPHSSAKHSRRRRMEGAVQKRKSTGPESRAFRFRLQPGTGRSLSFL
jgi:hypothetical protein